MLSWNEILLLLFVLIAVPALLIALPIYLLCGGLRSFALRPLQSCFEGLEVHLAHQPGDVSFVYHTYRGFFLWSTEDEHRIFASPDEATKLLRRLLWFNLTWGMLSHGQIFIPFLALGNYRAQMSAIERQRYSAEHQLGSILENKDAITNSNP